MLEKEGKIWGNLDSYPSVGRTSRGGLGSQCWLPFQTAAGDAVALGHCSASHTGSYPAPATGLISTRWPIRAYMV